LKLLIAEIGAGQEGRGYNGRMFLEISKSKYQISNEIQMSKNKIFDLEERTVIFCKARSYKQADTNTACEVRNKRRSELL